MTPRPLPLLLLLGLGACLSRPPTLTGEFPCEQQDDCATGYFCDVAASACREEEPSVALDDAGGPHDVDGGGGGGKDAGPPDAGVEGQADAGLALTDAGVIVSDAGDAGDVISDDAGPDAGTGELDAGIVAPRVVGIFPRVAPAGTVLWLEGTYPAGAVVNVTFPSGDVVSATVAGAGRAHLTVPVGAGSGDAFVDVDGAGFGPFPLRSPTFAIGLSPFQRQWEQTTYARQVPRLLSARTAHAAFASGPWLYVLGGLDDNGDVLASVERARVNADGSLGKMRLHVEALSQPRAQAAFVALPGRVFGIGGMTTSGETESVQSAPIDDGGELGAFVVETSELTAPRIDATATVIGGFLYVIGGRSSGQDLATVERALLSPHGTLGAFSVVPGVDLATARRSHVATVSGRWLYVIGGRDGGGALDSIERAPIGGDGSLGDFVNVGSLSDAKSGAAAFQLGDNVYVAGGIGSNDSVVELSAASDGSLGGPALSSTLADNREGHAAVVTRDRVWIIGGASGGVAQDTLEHARLHDGSVAPGPLVNESSLPVAVSYSQAVVSGDWLYLLGGYLVSGYTDVIQRAPIAADGSLGAFTALGSTLGGDRAFGCAAVAEDHVFLVGGYSASFTSWDSVHVAPVDSTGALGTFVDTGYDLNIASRLGTSCLVLGNQLYAVGGDDDYEAVTVGDDGMLAGDFQVAGVLQTVRDYATLALIEDRLYVFGDDQTDYERAVVSGGAPGAFSLFSRDPARYAAASVLIGPYLYFVGGLDDGGAVLSDTERADVRTTPLSFEAGGLAPETVGRGVSLVVLGDFVYRLGGRDETGPLTVVERAALP